jgi:hypothetical protein
MLAPAAAWADTPVVKAHWRGIVQAGEVAAAVGLTVANVLQLGADPATDGLEAADIGALAEAGTEEAASAAAESGAGEAASAGAETGAAWCSRRSPGCCQGGGGDVAVGGDAEVNAQGRRQRRRQAGRQARAVRQLPQQH